MNLKIKIEYGDIKIAYEQEPQTTLHGDEHTNALDIIDNLMGNIIMLIDKENS